MLVSSVRQPHPAKWALVARVVVQRKQKVSGNRPFRIIGDSLESCRFDYRVQSDLTPTLRKLEFASRKRIQSHGRAIGKRLQAIRRLTDRDAILLGNHVERLGTSPLENSLENAIKNGGGGFGDPETNEKVERAAIAHVESHYRSDGWLVQTKEKEHLGYDLLCKRRDEVLYLEVKGIQRTVQSFIITRNEKRKANDPRFKLCVVTSALTDPEMTEYTGDELLKQFDFTALAFKADLRRVK